MIVRLALACMLTLCLIPVARPPRAVAAAAAAVKLRAGFTAENIATVPRARELAVAPNGDLIVGTTGSAVYIVPDAQGSAGAPHPFRHVR